MRNLLHAAFLALIACLALPSCSTLEGQRGPVSKMIYSRNPDGSVTPKADGKTVLSWSRKIRAILDGGDKKDIILDPQK